MIVPPAPDAPPPALVLDLHPDADGEVVAVPLDAEALTDLEQRRADGAARDKAAAAAAAARDALLARLASGTASQAEVQAALASLLSDPHS